MCLAPQPGSRQGRGIYPAGTRAPHRRARKIPKPSSLTNRCGLKSALRLSRGHRAKDILAESAQHFLPCFPAARTGAMAARLYGLLPGIGDADHAAGDASAGITHRLTPVIDLRMHNQAPADDRILQAGNRYVLHVDFVVRLAVVVRLEISQIARV